MRILRFHGKAPSWARGAAVALGSFDGVHRGHLAVFDAARRIARAEGRPFAVLTFEPHPRSVLRPDAPPFRLSPFRTKARVLAGLGVDILVLVPFTAELAAKEPEAFVDEVLVAGLAARHVVTGHDFHFGRGRRGTPALLAALAESRGFGFVRVPAVGDGGAFSSTRVREALARGDVRAAAEMLGRWWEAESRVRKGAARGRALGYPTANLKLENTLAPARGIYAVWAAFEAGEDKFRPAVASFGIRPTFDGAGDLLEVHVFDFAGDLYGRHLRVRFVERIREEKKFDSAQALKEAMARDCAAARAILVRCHPAGPAPDAPAARGGRAG